MKASAARAAEQGSLLCAQLHKYKINIFILRGEKSSLPAKPLKYSLWASQGCKADLLPWADIPQPNPCNRDSPCCCTTGLRASILVSAPATLRTSRDKTPVCKSSYYIARLRWEKAKSFFVQNVTLLLLHCHSWDCSRARLCTLGVATLTVLKTCLLAQTQQPIWG